MFRYNLNSLSHESFAKLCNALLLATVSKRLRPFDTVGPDGGRDGDLVGPGDGPYSHLSGYWIFQYKHHDVARLGVSRARQLVRRDIEGSLSVLCASDRRRPDNYIMVTNVPFSGVLTTGTHDWFSGVASSYGLAHAEVWDYTKLEALIDANWEIRKAFFPELTYTDRFFKDVTDRMASSILWESLGSIASGEALEPSPRFATQGDYDRVLDLLWAAYEELTGLGSSLATITNYMYSWPELNELASIAKLNDDYVVRLGEDEYIGPIGSSGGSSRSAWSVMSQIVRRAEASSWSAHRAILEVVELNRGVAALIVNAMEAYFADERPSWSNEESPGLVAPFQYMRLKTVQEVIGALDEIITINEEGRGGMPDGAFMATSVFHNAIDLTVSVRYGLRSTIRSLDRSMIAPTRGE